MKRFILMLLVAALNVCAWGQYYKFSSTAQGNLYTEANDASVATTPEGDVCSQNYYVKSNYAPTDAPSKETIKAFNVKDYYVNIDGNYLCAFGQAYDEEKAYAVADVTELIGDLLNVKLSTKSVFTSVANYYKKINEEYVHVTEGEEIVPTTIYYPDPSNPSWTVDGATIAGWHDKSSSTIQSFESTSGIYTKEDGIYTPISSTAYDSEKTYYSVSFTDLEESEKSAMASTDANFSITEVVTGLDGVNKIYYYNSGTASYVEVQNGDEYLGDNAYYKEQASFALRTPSELRTLGYANQVSGLVSLNPSDDGKTLTIECAGDVCEPGESFETDGYKFQNLASGWLFSDQEGTVVNNGDIYYNTKHYYTREMQYSEAAVPTANFTIYRFKVGIDLYKGHWEWDGNIQNNVLVYDAVSEEKWDGFDDNGNTNYYTRSQAYTYTPIADFSTLTTSETKFNAAAVAAGVKIKNGEVYTAVAENEVLINDAEYYTGDAESYTLIEDFTPYITNIITFTQDVYSDQEGTVASAGSVKENDATYYTRSENGYNYTCVQASEIKSTYTTEDTEKRVQTGSTTYYKGDSKTPVNNNEVFESTTTYYTSDGSIYTEKTFEELNSESKLLYTTVADNYWQALVNEINANGYKEVVFKTKSGEANPALICNTVTQNLMKVKTVRVLNYSGVAIDHIASPYTSGTMADANENGTFVVASDIYNSNHSIETLYTPQVVGTDEGDGALWWGTFARIPNLRYLTISEGVTELKEKSVSRTTFWLSTLTFPNSLRIAREQSVEGHYNVSTKGLIKDLDNNDIPCIETLVFPEGMQIIESRAFEGTCPKDVYFLGVKAPKVGLHAWGDDAYLSNNAFSPSVTIGTKDATTTVYVEKGLATRMNYTAQSGYIAMLHYPAACTPAQAACYTDLTRDYRRVAYNTYGWESGATVYDPQDGKMSFDGQYTWYTPGEETEDIKGVGHATSGVALKRFGNMYAWGDGTSFPASTYPEGYYGGNYSGGYHDFSTDSQYHWPSIVMGYRATVVAQNNKLWNGVSSIGDGIRAAGGQYADDGSEYRGLHQFILAAGDAGGSSTTEWEMEKYKDGKWHTICLPFNMTKKQMKEVFGAVGKDAETGKYLYSIRLCMFTNVERNHDNITIRFNDERFVNAEDDNIVLHAHVSYMIKAVKGDVLEPIVFNNYKIEKGGVIPTEIRTVGDAGNGVYRFIGNYSMYNDAGTARMYMPQYSYFFSASYYGFKFQAGTTGKWNPYSSVVMGPEGTGLLDYNAYFSNPSSQAKVNTFFFGDDDNTTEVKSVTIATGNELIYTNARIYNANGMYVGDSMEGLNPGLYIVAGKKFIVK